MREFPRPRIEVEQTDFGLRLIDTARDGRKHTHVRVTNLVFPHAFVIPMSRGDDHHAMARAGRRSQHYWYAIFTSFGAPVDKDEMRRQRLRAL